MSRRQLLAWLTFSLAVLTAACGGSTSNQSGGGAGGAGGVGAGGAGSGGVGAGGVGTGGAGGSGGALPPLVPASKLDLLFVVDNSRSMADQQELLGQAVMELARHLLVPKVDATGQLTFKPIVDIHIGMISTSLGGHGGDQCSPNGPAANPTQNDMAHLIPSVRQALPSYQGFGFLWWDPTGTKANPPGEGNLANLLSQLQAWVSPGGVGESGCGYAAPLEAWYRFLVDPSPSQAVVVNANSAELQGIDDVVLQQRKDFLRPDSAVVIVMLSDGNDCSVVDGSYNWIVTQSANPNGAPYHLPRATVACDQDPSSACCQSCASAQANTGCPLLADDANCKLGLWDDAGDPPNLRCWQQKRRFGINFLYPTRRYVEALTQAKICPKWDGLGPTCDPNDPNARVPNPLFVNTPDGSGAPRDPRLVFLSGIVGVPWQDLASADTLNDPYQLRYLTASEMAAQGRWSWLVPGCKQMKGGACDEWDETDDPDDPLMVEAIAPRTGTNPALGVPLVDPSGSVLSNPINGHEWITSNDDLEFACIYELGTPKDCATATGGCDCSGVGPGYSGNNPVCQDSTGGYGTVQQYAKAYPGLRELEVMKDLGDNGIPGSLCAKRTAGDPEASVWGYNATADAILGRLLGVMQQ